MAQSRIPGFFKYIYSTPLLSLLVAFATLKQHPDHLRLMVRKVFLVQLIFRSFLILRTSWLVSQFKWFGIEKIKTFRHDMFKRISRCADNTSFETTHWKLHSFETC